MMIRKILGCIGLVGLMCFVSCKKDRGITESESQPTAIGQKLENPYSVENMRKAMGNLRNSNDDYRMADLEIEATHLYLKFMPQNEDQLSLLLQDSTVVYYTYPLDHELLDGTDEYHDPEIPDSLPTYQYCAVPINKVLTTDVPYEILEELFIPDEYEDEGSYRYASEDLTEALVDEALRITDNLEQEDELQDHERRRRKWRPAGTLNVWDDNKGKFIPLEGVKVRARRWFTTRTGISNSNGYYSCNGKFRRKARYSIKWKRYDFSVRKGLRTAKYGGPKKKGNWNLNIKGGRQEFYATIFRAANHYYYKDIKGLRTPPRNGFWRTKLKIRACYETNDNSNGNYMSARRFLGLGSAIKIYNPHHNSMNIYATVIHELAHASHWNMGSWNFYNTSDIVVESWARGVEWELTRMVYEDYQPIYFGAYSGVVQDMVDGIDRNYDQVKGYTIRQLEDVLEDEKTWNGWKNNIKNTYNNDTKEKLDALFNYWN